jgi:hypothetical protein
MGAKICQVIIFYSEYKHNILALVGNAKKMKSKTKVYKMNAL